MQNIECVQITKTSKRKLASGGVEITGFTCVANFNWAATKTHVRTMTKPEAMHYATYGVDMESGDHHPIQFYTNVNKVALVHPEWPKTASVHTNENGWLKTASDRLPENNLDNLPDM